MHELGFETGNFCSVASALGNKEGFTEIEIHVIKVSLQERLTKLFYKDKTFLNKNLYNLILQQFF